MPRHTLLTSILLTTALSTLGATNSKGYRTLYLTLNNGYELYVGQADYMQISDGCVTVKTEHDYIHLNTDEIKGWHYGYTKDIITSKPIIEEDAAETAVSYSSEGIRISIPDTPTGGTISIYNTNGEVVRQMPCAQSIFVSYTELPSGVNILRLPGENGYSTIKLNVK